METNPHGRATEEIGVAKRLRKQANQLSDLTARYDQAAADLAAARAEALGPLEQGIAADEAWLSNWYEATEQEGPQDLVYVQISPPRTTSRAEAIGDEAVAVAMLASIPYLEMLTREKRTRTLDKKAVRAAFDDPDSFMLVVRDDGVLVDRESGVALPVCMTEVVHPPAIKVKE